MDDFSVNFFIDVLIINNINNIKYNAFQLACAFQSATIVYFSYAPFSVFLWIGRKYWRISKQRLSKISLVVGHVDGIVKEVIVPEKWHLSTDPRYPNRYECIGKELEDSPYLNKDASQLITIGQNPVAYYNCD